jgi:hypothetical protein
MKTFSTRTRIFVGLVVFFGAAILVQVPLTWGHSAFARFAGTLLVALLAARLKVSLPKLNGSMSVNLPFILLAISELSLAEALLIATASTLVQCLVSESRPPKPIQVVFSMGVVLMAVEAAWLTMQTSMLNAGARLALGGLVFLLVNTFPVATIISLTEGGNVLALWKRITQLTFPYFVLGAGVAGLVKLAGDRFAWYVPLLILPLMFFVQRSFMIYFQTLRDATEPKTTYAMAAGAGRG